MLAFLRQLYFWTPYLSFYWLHKGIYQTTFFSIAGSSLRQYTASLWWWPCYSGAFCTTSRRRPPTPTSLFISFRVWSSWSTSLCRGDNGDLLQLGPLSQFPWFGWYSPWSTGQWGALITMGTTTFTLFSNGVRPQVKQLVWPFSLSLPCLSFIVPWPCLLSSGEMMITFSILGSEFHMKFIICWNDFYMIMMIDHHSLSPGPAY